MSTPRPHRGRRQQSGALSLRASQDFRDRLAQRQCARRRNDTLGRSEEKRIVQELAQSPKAMADGRRRQVQSSGGAPDMTLIEHDLKQDEQIEIDPSEMSQFQHIAESISLASANATAHDVNRTRCGSTGDIQMAKQHDRQGYKAPQLVLTRRAAVAALAAVPLSTAPTSASDAVAALIARVAETALVRSGPDRARFHADATLRRSGESRLRHEARALGRDVSILPLPQRNVRA